jgi:glycosyltransferase involved in cell wall biosynthesis
MELTIIRARRVPFNPEVLRTKYLAQALKERSIKVKIVELPPSRSAYLKSLFPPKFERVLYTSPPIFNVLYASRAPNVYGDLRDPWDVYLEESGNIAKRILSYPLLIRYFRVLERSSFLAATTKSIAGHYENILRKKVYVIPNGTDPQILFCKNKDRVPEIVVLADFRNPYLPLNPLLNASKKLGVKVHAVGPSSENVGGVFSHPPLNYAELNNLCKFAIGAIPRPFKGKTYAMTIPTKTYDYMALGMCIFAYGPKDSELQKLIEENEIGYYAFREEDIVNKLHLCLKNWKEKGARAREMAERVFDRKRLSERYAELLLQHL